MPTRRELSRSPITLQPITSRPVNVASVENAIRRDVETSVKKQLKLTGTLPADVKEIVQAAAQSAATTSVELAVARAAEEAARDVGRRNITTRFDEKIKVAADSLAHISKSDEVEEVLKRRSELLAKKRTSLLAVGFSNEESMQILLADIAARAH
ncbi:MAG TPA: hypothetical protein VMQ65_06900 [Candidatus Limnocylindria bacterium]|nr:hypothetical protein [Candidatus Limnocylindria bacterium]